MGVVVIAAYRPKPGQEARLIEVLRRHPGALKLQGLVTDLKPVVMKAKDGTYVEVFEWKSAAAIEAAHKNPAVKELWAKFEEVCEHVKLMDLAESHGLFASFERMNLPVGL